MLLTDREKAMLDGKAGQAVRIAMTILANLGLGAAAASSGSIALFHVIGVTPEAHTRERCLKEQSLRDAMVVTPDMIRAMEEKLWTTAEEWIEWVG
jgi:predicted aconitase